MKNKILLFLLIINSVYTFSQEMPLYMNKLPSNVNYKFLKSIDTFKEKSTDLYEFNLGENTYFIKITTSDLPDCILLIDNSYNGGEIYKKQSDNKWLRIIECRENGNEYGIYLINNQNESSKFFSMQKVILVNLVLL